MNGNPPNSSGSHPHGRWVLTSESFTFYNQVSFSLEEKDSLVLSMQEMDNLKTGESKLAETHKVWALSFGYKDALEKSGISSPQSSLYYVPLDCWIFEKEKKTYFVSWKMLLSFTGSHVSLAHNLNEQSIVQVDLYSWTLKKDPQGLAEALKKAGFEVMERVEKGGHFSGKAKIEADRLIEYLVIREKHQ
jgi:hypothetical protein